MSFYFWVFVVPLTYGLQCGEIVESDYYEYNDVATCDAPDSMCVRVRADGEQSVLGLFTITETAEFGMCLPRSACFGLTCSQVEDYLRNVNELLDTIDVTWCGVKCCYGDLCNAVSYYEVVNLTMPTTAVLTTPTTSTQTEVDENSAFGFMPNLCVLGLIVLYGFLNM